VIFTFKDGFDISLICEEESNISEHEEIEQMTRRETKAGRKMERSMKKKRRITRSREQNARRQRT
jgi:hypothetical protein